MKEIKKGVAAIIVAAGNGSRMGGKIPKQYLLLNGRPVLYYSVRAFLDYGVETLVLVIPEGDQSYCQTEILEKNGLSLEGIKLVSGGMERYESVRLGLLQVQGCEIVLIHDAARPLIDQETIRRAEEGARRWGAAVAGVPAKDTMKLADEAGNVSATLQRSRLWSIQTPQAFRYSWIHKAHEILRLKPEEANQVTDDGMLIEKYLGEKVKITMGSYRNQKITTPEDQIMLEALLRAAQS